MRRHYAFESEKLPSAVKDQLEKVEDAVDKKCTSVEACDKMLDKISAEQDKFNGCLKDMAGAAKDCKDGKCDSAEMAAKVSPKMAELKEVAKSIGVASEGETVTEDEVKAAKQYLEGAEEIVEAKKDELGAADGGDDKPKDDGDGPAHDDDGDADDGCEDGECDDAEAAEDAYLSVPGFESYTGSTVIDFASACESMAAESWIAMEGYNWDKRKEYNAKRDEIKALVKQAKQAAKAGNVPEAKSKMEKAVSDLQAFKKDFVKECNQNQSAGTAIIGYFAYGWRGFGLSLLASLPTFGLGGIVVALKHEIEFWVDLIQAIAKYSKGEEPMSPADFNMYTKSMEHNMDIMIGHYKSVAKKIVAKAEKKAGVDTSAADANEAFTNFIAACESFMIEQPKKGSAPYLFD